MVLQVAVKDIGQLTDLEPSTSPRNLEPRPEAGQVSGTGRLCALGLARHGVVALTGVDAPVPTVDGPVDWPRLEAMTLGMIEGGVSVLAVVHFPAGCVAAAPGGQTWRQGSVRLLREQVRSTTGAGDAFAAGVILGLHEDWPVERCLRLAVASAAASVRSPNTSNGIKSTEACLAEADRAGYHRLPGSSRVLM
jgi:sugar/nucleoside kinase (ribokinase family)